MSDYIQGSPFLDDNFDGVTFRVSSKVLRDNPKLAEELQRLGEKFRDLAVKYPELTPSLQELIYLREKMVKLGERQSYLSAHRKVLKKLKGLISKEIYMQATYPKTYRVVASAFMECDDSRLPKYLVKEVENILRKLSKHDDAFERIVEAFGCNDVDDFSKKVFHRFHVPNWSKSEFAFNPLTGMIEFTVSQPVIVGKLDDYYHYVVRTNDDGIFLQRDGEVEGSRVDRFSKLKEIRVRLLTNEDLIVSEFTLYVLPNVRTKLDEVFESLDKEIPSGFYIEKTIWDA